MTFFIQQSDVPVEVFLVQVFAGENDDRLLHLLIDLLEKIRHHPGIYSIQIRTGFISKQEARLVQDRPGDRETLLLATQEFPGEVPVAQIGRSSGGFRSRESGLSGALQRDRRFHSRPDREEGHSPGRCCPVCKEKRSPLVTGKRTQHTRERSFPAATCPHDTEELAFPDLKVDPIEPPDFNIPHPADLLEIPNPDHAQAHIASWISPQDAGLGEGSEPMHRKIICG